MHDSSNTHEQKVNMPFISYSSPLEVLLCLGVDLLRPLIQSCLCFQSIRDQVRISQGLIFTPSELSHLISGSFIEEAGRDSCVSDCEIVQTGSSWTTLHPGEVCLCLKLVHTTWVCTRCHRDVIYLARPGWSWALTQAMKNVVLLRALNASSAVQPLLTGRAVTQKFHLTYFRDLWDMQTVIGPFINHSQKGGCVPTE